MELPKSGYNKFGKYHYYELEDILPAIFQECYNQELFLEFSFTNELAQLKIRNWNEPGESLITSVPLPEIVPLNKGMNIMQSEGSYITYAKRYLLVNIFHIMEKDVIDSDSTGENVSETVTASNSVQKIREYIHSKDSSIEITPTMINTNRMKMFKAKKLTKEENQEAYKWYQEQERKDVI